MRRAPGAGEDSDDVFSRILGLSATDLSSLRKQGVV
jgi:hypothetical protein